MKNNIRIKNLMEHVNYNDLLKNYNPKKQVLKPIKTYIELIALEWSM
jgi:hypothetical protein